MSLPILVKLNPLGAIACLRACSPLVLNRLRDFVLGPILTTTGFAIDGKRLKCRIDPVFPGSVIVLEPIEGVTVGALTPTNDSYGEEPLLFAHSVQVSFEGRTISMSAPLLRFETAYDMAGPQYDSILGLPILKTHAFAFDFHGMKMWIADSN